MTDNEEKRSEEAVEKLVKAAQLLGEHFDSVHIFANRHEPATADGTITFNAGVGNWYSRYGQIREWVLLEEEKMRSEATKPSDDE